MDPNLPVPKPRSGVSTNNEPLKRPIPLPRSKVPSNTELFRSIGAVSKQISEDVAAKVQHSAKAANEKIEKTLSDGSRFAKGTIEKTLLTSRAVRDSVTKSVIEGTKNSLRLRKTKRYSENSSIDEQRCMSMPVQDVSLFDNIQFNSPLLEQKMFPYEALHDGEHEFPVISLNNSNLDDLSLFSSNSDSNADTISNFSHDSRELESIAKTILNPENGEKLTYDTPRASRANSVISVALTPEVPERRKKRESSLDFMRQNSLYENWNLPGDTMLLCEVLPRPSKSTIYEFDPLNTVNTKPSYEGVSNELILLESFIIGDTYGSIVTNDSHEDNFEDVCENDYFNPPTPPERSDSLITEELDNAAKEKNIATSSSKATTPKDRNSNWFINEDDSVKPFDENEKSSVMQKFSNILKLDNVLNKNGKQVTQKVEVVERPPINDSLAPFYSGILTQIISGGMDDLFKNSQSRYCVLSEQRLLCYSDTTNSVLKEAYTLDSIYSVQIVLPLSASTNNNYCFELSVNGGSMRSTPRRILFSCNSASERRNWAQKIAEHLTGGFPTKYTAEYTRCGWCYMKEGVSGEWQGTWVMLIRRVLVYYSGRDSAVRTVDLRKTRCVVTQEADEDTKQRCPADGTPNLLLDCPDATLYLRFAHERELKGWRYIVKLAAHNNGSYLHHQQLTKEDVPAIVDKCISFIYAHGSLSEGIYRRAGSNSVLSELLARFRRDAWSVQLSPGSHSEHDVAGALKRFFRDLPESLVPTDEHTKLISILDIEDENARLSEFGRVMRSLPLVQRRTARKLFAHLHFIHTLASANKMTADNLAAVWAPTIMPGKLASNSLQTAWSSKELVVVRDLIANYERIWEPTDVEKRRENAVRCVLMRVMSTSAPAPPKAAGDLKAWVYVKDRINCHQVTLTPNKRCSDVCIELCEKANMESYLLTLEEVICGESLRRIIHIDEVVLDVVLRWGYWDEDDRKDNYLLLTENKLLQEVEALKNSTSHVCGALKYANEMTKSFKTHMFEFKNGKLCYFKDKQGSHKLEEWDIRDILWYSGHEPRRAPQSRWAITFIPKNNKRKRSKERPWFGCTIAGAVTEDQLKWMAAMMFAEHSVILPTPRLVIT